MEDLVTKVEKEIENVFKIYDRICEKNEGKILNTFIKHKVDVSHLNGTTGYGYGDKGRDIIEKIYADIFKTEDALVRNQFISGTHTISTVLFGVLRPGDILLSINGKPYDTLDEVIGIKENPSSLISYGIKYEQIDLINSKFDIEKVKSRVSRKDIKMIAIQRSRGYEYRDAFLISELKEAIDEIRSIDKDVIIMVDNCYGEFVDEFEPTEVGASIVVGSLIKNIGGGIAPTGGYICGTRKLIELISDKYSAPGLGKEGGATFDFNRKVLQGLFMAPHVVNQSLKTVIFASKLIEELGYEVSPKYNEKRSDIVQMIKFKDEQKLIKFCQGIQIASPIDSNVVPEAWDMPGYSDKIIMASGAFTEGSSIEISCDGPIRPPYIAFLQGSLTYGYGKLAVIKAAKNIT